jgi:hypothetical protein
MSYALVFGALAALIVIVGGIAGMFWWVRRPTPHLRSAPDVPLPLFSHSRAAVWLRDEDDVSDESNAELISARVERHEGSRASPVPSWSVPLPDVAAPSAPATASRRPEAAGGMRTQPPPSSWKSNGGGAPTDAARHVVPPRPTSAPLSSPRPAPQSSVQFSVPTDATLQFLPGRLEIVTGSDAGREVRFVRLPGASATRITFGRSVGEPYRHVQLHDATVSRDHAVMQLREGQWCLVNHSATNPVLHNGVELAQQEEVMLRDGDRVEMGEVTFRFRM